MNSLRHNEPAFQTLVGLAFALGLFCPVSVAMAQSDTASPSRAAFDAEPFAPSGELGAMLGVWTADVPLHLVWSSALWLDAGYRPVSVLRDFSPAPNAEALDLYAGEIVEWRSDARFTFQIGLFDRVALGFEVPFVLVQKGLDNTFARDELDYGLFQNPRLGDLKTSAKALLLKQGEFWPALAVGGRIGIPTGIPQQLTGQPGLVIETIVSTSRTFGSIALAANLGYRLRTENMRLGDEEIGDQLMWGLGLEYAMRRRSNNAPQTVVLEMVGKLPVEGHEGLGERFPIELRGALVKSFLVGNRSSLDFSFGLGAGLIRSPGTPLVRFYTAIGYTSEHGWLDTDSDGMVDRLDGCVDQPEDYDGLADTDGCPEYDYDGDRVDDFEDDCPEVAEDRDGVDDWDGCPDPEIGDADDDSIFDDLDACPEQPEDFDGFEDNDGCPEQDNDGDGLADLNDLCPDAPEDINQHEDDDGCPDGGGRAKLFTVLDDNSVRLNRPLLFKRGRSLLQRRSKVVLDQLADHMRTNTAIEKLIITVHPQKKSQRDLSKKRAETLRKLLLERGVESWRLRVKAGAWSRFKAGAILIGVER